MAGTGRASQRAGPEEQVELESARRGLSQGRLGKRTGLCCGQGAGQLPGLSRFLSRKGFSTHARGFKAAGAGTRGGRAWVFHREGDEQDRTPALPTARGTR